MDGRNLGPEAQKKLATPIEKLGLGPISLGALRTLELRTLADVCACEPDDISVTKGIGPKAMTLLRDCIAQTGERWGDEILTRTDPEPAPTPPCSPIPKAPTLGAIGHKHPAAIEAELPFAMEDMFGLPRGLLRPQFMAKLRKALNDNHPEIQPSPLTALFMRNGESPFADVPVAGREAFERRMRLLNLLHVVVQDEQGEQGGT